MIKPARSLLAATCLAVLVSGCSLAPNYARPTTVEIPPSFKELSGWKTATPNDAVARGEWWDLLNDPVLNALESKVIVSNQNLAAAKAAYDQATALVRQQRASLFPTIGLQPKITDDGNFETNPSSTSSSATSSNALQVQIGTSWAPDLWGALGNTARQSGALAQASAGDLANATLSAQGELALDYVQLRGIEAQKKVLDTTVADYARALTITTNRYKSGVAARSDVYQAETALHNANAAAADLDRQRANFEHAIAVLVGENPSTFSLAPREWSAVVPDVPSIVPSALLERRPDIAAAERRVSAANYGIGIQRAAAFPSITLTGGVGSNASGVAGLFSVANMAWSLGLSGVVSIFDFGANKAKVAQARAAYDQTVAEYRQTVLTAFQQTEDQLAATRVLEDVALERSAATLSSTRAETIARNQYLAGIIAYSDVITAQTTALSARTSEIQAVTNRQVAAISLVQAIGGKWNG